MVPDMNGAMVRAGLTATVATLLLGAAPAAAHPLHGGLAATFGEQALTQETSDAGARAALTGRNGQFDDRAAQAQAQAPPLVPTPRADCGQGSRRETGIQGRVPPGSEEGFSCNMTLVSHHGPSGGYKALRFKDKTGRECAYYDTTLLFPTNVQTLSERPTGVAVLDMSNPAKPVQTAFLSTPAMQTPHESLVLNEKRGLLVAVMGNPVVYPGVVDVYDLNEDCRAPALQSSLPVGLLGHESGFAPDGNTFYATSLSTGQITAVDLGNPKLPVPLAVGQYRSHGLMVSDDGNRAYVAASSGLIILDTSDIQARKPNPQFREISRLTWPSLTIPQIATPVTIGGKPYLVEIDEFSSNGDSTSVASNGNKVGAARIIDIANEKAPREVSNIRLAVHQPENRAALANDPGASSSLQGYAGHYCNVPSRVEPGILACSMIASGLRVFDIRDPEKPKEIAYYVAPNKRSNTAGSPSNYAMSSPTFAPERNEVWYTDGNSGFYALKLSAEAASAQGLGAGGAGCASDAGFRSVSAQPIGRRIRLGYTRRLNLPVRVDMFQVSQGRRVIKERLVARLPNARRSVVFKRELRDGYYFARFTMRRGGRAVDVRRIVLRRQGGRFSRVRGHYQRESCKLLRSFKLKRPVFGGRRATPLRIAYRVSSAARVTVTVTRQGKSVKRFKPANRAAGRTYRLSLAARGRPRGRYTVRLKAVSGGTTTTATLSSRRL